MQPRSDRPRIPREYGTPTSAKGMLEWDYVERRLTDARAYWVATSGPGGRPRVRPVDGIYVDGTIYVGGSPKTRWVRDLFANANVSVHLDGPEVVIVEGVAELLERVPRDTAERLAAASNAKYPEYKMTPESYSGPGPWAIRPRKVVAWTNFAKDPTRFRFDS
jgi:hypothetical protein